MNRELKTTEIYVKNRIITVSVSNHFSERFVNRCGYYDLNLIIKGSWIYNPKTDKLPNNVSSELFHSVKGKGDYFYLINNDFKTLIAVGKNDKWWYHNACELILVTIISLTNNPIYEDEFSYNFEDNYTKPAKMVKLKVGRNYYSVAA